VPPGDVDAGRPDSRPDNWPDEWPDESTRPRVTDPDEVRTGHPNQQLLTQVHAHLREELARLTETLEQLVASGSDDVVGRDAGVGDVRAFLSRMAGRQNSYSLGAFCAAYCRTVATHHAIEDARMFPDIAAADPALRPVVDRLESEHLVIAGHLDALDRAVVSMVAGDGGGDGGGRNGTQAVLGAATALTRVLRSHLDYEEEQLLGPLGRLPLVV
jgi:hypothetical protein